MLTKTETLRYQKHLFLPEIGQIGQEKLKAAKVLVVGAGGLGCPVLLYLSAAGIGNIGIVDGDKVELSNLQRQVLYDTNDIGVSKAECAEKHLKAKNNEINFTAYHQFLKAENAHQIIDNYDIVVDCTDNFKVRYLINDTCVAQKKPFVYGAIHKFEGQVAVFNYCNNEGVLGPTYRCIFPNQPSESEIPNCATVGVLGVLPGTIGMFQANEVVKMILGIGKVLSGEMLLIDLLENVQQKIKIKRKEQVTINVIEPKEAQIETKMENKTEINQISVHELNERIASGEAIHLIDVRNEYEFGICGLTNAQLIPLNDIENKVNQIPKDIPVVIFCHHGMRSAHAIKTLKKLGEFTNLINLEGGIDAWAAEIDPDMNRY
jgi:sulfur-carrier protein adenylyltransferase/sulfurtransferase